MTLFCSRIDSIQHITFTLAMHLASGVVLLVAQLDTGLGLRGLCGIGSVGELESVRVERHLEGKPGC